MQAEARITLPAATVTVFDTKIYTFSVDLGAQYGL